MSQNPEEITLIRDVVAAPDDDAPRLMYAAWLESHGQEDRARLIRLQCSIVTQQHEVDALIRQHGREWACGVSAVGGKDWVFHRGFPEEVTLPFRDFLSYHERLNDITPLCRLRLVGQATDDADADLAALAQLPVGRQFRALEFAAPHAPIVPAYTAEGVRSLAMSPHMTGLRELALHSRRVGPDGVAAIADSPFLASLTRLTMTDPACGANEHSLLRLIRSPHLPNLNGVWLGDTIRTSVQNIRALAGDHRPCLPPERR